MKSIILFLAIVAAYLAGAPAANAHAIWIESNAKATKSKPHEVKIFYGEYPEGEIETTAKWYSDLKTLEVWVVRFTPKIKGSYVLEASDYQPENGEWQQKPYTHSWKGATTRILIN